MPRITQRHSAPRSRPRPACTPPVLRRYSACTPRVNRLNSASTTPQLHVLRECDFELSTASTQWFLLGFLTALPPETVARVWDLLFLHGAHVLFAGALATLHSLAAGVLNAEGMEQVPPIRNRPARPRIRNRRPPLGIDQRPRRRARRAQRRTAWPAPRAVVQLKISSPPPSPLPLPPVLLLLSCRPAPPPLATCAGLHAFQAATRAHARLRTLRAAAAARARAPLSRRVACNRHVTTMYHPCNRLVTAL